MSDSTVERILDAGQEMARKGGFHDFSFRAIAAEVGVKSASVHYHFPTKGDLGAAVVKRYRMRFGESLADASNCAASACDRLSAFAGLFREPLSGGQLCLCGVLGAETGGLPHETAAEVERFFRDNEIWLTGVIAAGRETGELYFSADPPVVAFSFLCLLEGAMMVAQNLGGDVKRFDQAVEAFLCSMKTQR